MFGVKLDQAKSMFFFDKEGKANPILRSLDAATRNVLSRFGAFVRRTAKASIRKRKAISEPGNPPSSHVGLLRQFIYFGYDPAQRSVVIGPTRLNAKEESTPEHLEYGGTFVLCRDRVIGMKTIVKAGTTLNYRARPFIRPAKEKELPKLPAMWRDSVKP